MFHILIRNFDILIILIRVNLTLKQDKQDI